MGSVKVGREGVAFLERGWLSGGVRGFLAGGFLAVGAVFLCAGCGGTGSGGALAGGGGWRTEASGRMVWTGRPGVAAPAGRRAEAVARAAPERAVLPAGSGEVTRNGVDLVFVVFDDREWRLEVADQAGGPGSEWATAARAGRAEGAAAALNGGFFTPEGEPLGRVVDGGEERGRWNFSSALCSGVYGRKGAAMSLMRARRWGAGGADDLLQGGPFLVEGGKVGGGLSREADRARSFVAWDGIHHWALGYTRSATLHELARTLAGQPLAARGMRIESALNLDGGRSADLWVSEALKGGPRSERMWWNKAVRNFLVLKRVQEPESEARSE